VPYKSLHANIKDLDTKQGVVSGYFAAFNNKDSDGDIIVPGAFSETLKLNGPASKNPRIKHLLDHDRTKGIGVLTELEEDTYGLRYVSKAGSWTLGQDFLKMCEGGLITEHSIGYSVQKGQPDKNQDAYMLLELRLWEGSSLQAWGANPNTPLLGVKSDGDLVSAFQTLTKALERGTYTDDTFKLIERDYKRIGELLKAQQKPAEPDYTALAQAITKNFNATIN
jgi:uncharacterized protein